LLGENPWSRTLSLFLFLYENSSFLFFCQLFDASYKRGFFLLLLHPIRAEGVILQNRSSPVTPPSFVEFFLSWHLGEFPSC